MDPGDVGQHLASYLMVRDHWFCKAGAKGSWSSRASAFPPPPLRSLLDPTGEGGTTGSSEADVQTHVVREEQP